MVIFVLFVRFNCIINYYSSDDIIQENFIDTYYNLTLKSIFMLKWFNNRCLNKGKNLTNLQFLQIIFFSQISSQK